MDRQDRQEQQASPVPQVIQEQQERPPQDCAEHFLVALLEMAGMPELVARQETQERQALEDPEAVPEVEEALAGLGDCNLNKLRHTFQAVAGQLELAAGQGKRGVLQLILAGEEVEVALEQ